MTAFWIGAGALAAAALAFLLVPLWRERKASGRWSLAALVAAVAMVPLAFALYAHVRTWQPELVAQRAQEIEQRRRELALVEQLAKKMAERPDDVQGWRLLGRSYVALGEYTDARRAFEEAWRRTPNPDNDLKLSLAEAYVLEDQSALTGPAGRLIDEVLQEEPSNPKALWYGGQRAVWLGDHAAARDRLTRLLALGNVPEPLARVIEAQLAELPPASEAGAGESGAERAATAGGPLIEVSVELAEGLSTERVGPNATLFIFARAPGGGPPLAAIRASVESIPGKFVLSDRAAMLPGQSLADFPEIELIARVSLTGQATESAGDLFGVRVLRPGEESQVDIVIDRVVE